MTSSEATNDNEAGQQQRQIEIQGHRGARGLRPENTLPAFRKALELGVHTLEMDVVISRDRQVVVSHEPWFSSDICSTPDGNPIEAGDEQRHRIFDLDYAEVRRYDCGVRQNPRFPLQESTPAFKPLLNEVIDLAESYVRQTGREPVEYNIETKSTPSGDGVLHPPPDIFAGLLVDVIESHGVVERAVIQSFDMRTLVVSRNLNPDIRLSLLVAYPLDKGIDVNLEMLGFTPAIYSPDYRLVDQAMIDRAHQLGMRVIPWTVNKTEEMQGLIALGIDGIITDYPDVGVQLGKNQGRPTSHNAAS